MRETDEIYYQFEHDVDEDVEAFDHDGTQEYPEHSVISFKKIVKKYQQIVKSENARSRPVSSIKIKENTINDTLRRGGHIPFGIIADNLRGNSYDILAEERRTCDTRAIALYGMLLKLGKTHGYNEDVAAFVYSFVFRKQIFSPKIVSISGSRDLRCLIENGYEINAVMLQLGLQHIDILQRMELNHQRETDEEILLSNEQAMNLKIELGYKTWIYESKLYYAFGDNSHNIVSTFMCVDIVNIMKRQNITDGEGIMKAIQSGMVYYRESNKIVDSGLLVLARVDIVPLIHIPDIDFAIMDDYEQLHYLQQEAMPVKKDDEKKKDDDDNDDDDDANIPDNFLMKNMLVTYQTDIDFTFKFNALIELMSLDIINENPSNICSFMTQVIYFNIFAFCSLCV